MGIIKLASAKLEGMGVPFEVGPGLPRGIAIRAGNAPKRAAAGYGDSRSAIARQIKDGLSVIIPSTPQSRSWAA